MYEAVIIFISGGIIGAFITYLVMRFWLKNAEEKLQGKFAAISFELLEKISQSLSRENEQVLQHERKESEKALDGVNKSIEDVRRTVHELEKDRVAKFTELSQALQLTHRDTEALAKLTRELHSVIYQKQARGQWGERMAEDILRFSGFQEGINYYRQHTLSGGSRPDFSFLLPKGTMLNMDVKFPLENFARYVDAESELEAENYMKVFLSDVKGHIRTINRKEYTSPNDNSLDYVIMFVPSDLIYTSIFQADAGLLDYALRQHVILCSPATLFAVLAVIRQAVDNFMLESSTSEALNTMKVFLAEWKTYCEKTENIGKRLEVIQKEFAELKGIRTQRLEVPLAQFKAIIKD